MARKRRASKGSFSEVGLSVAKKYLYPSSRRRMLWWGFLAALVLVALALADLFYRDAHFVSNGPLSSAHATLENDCAACHTPFGKVTSDACSTCHEKYGDELGVYSFASHFVYRSNDFQRIQAHENETECAACHTEHLGRDAQITRLEDARCLSCHPYGSFNRDHPAFELAEGPDDDALAFTHTHHTNEVMLREGLLDVERACLYCHNPQADGKSFEPLDFDRHCDACHLTATTTTARLPIEDGDEPGVVTLAELIDQPAPGTRWALFANPNEYRQTGSRVSKAPVHHADPWILENLRRLRRLLYPDAGLAELLQTSPDAPPSEIRALYEEAVATLEDHALGLRNRPEPEIQEELQYIEQVLAGVKQALADPYTALDETKFLLALDGPQNDLSEERTAAVSEMVDQLTLTCQTCHRIDRATIARVQTDQQTFRRAEFDHRAHILQVRCLDCHTKIRIADGIGGEIPSGETEHDRAAIQNLPTIEQCQECHQPKVSANSCVTCHEFHPDKSRRSDLLLYLTEEDREAAGAESASATR